MLVDVVLGGADVFADEAEVGDLSHADRRGAGIGVAPGEHGDEGIRAEVDEFHGCVAHGTCHERDIDVALVEMVDEDGVLVLLDCAHDEAGDLAAHAADDVGEQLDGDALERPDDEPAARARGDVGDFLARGIEAVEDHLRVREQGATDGSQDDGLGSPGPLEDRAAHEDLEPRDLLADRRLGVAEDVGCPAEGALLGDRTQGLEVAHLVARRSEEHGGSLPV